jgi:hypothetical protein
LHQAKVFYEVGKMIHAGAKMIDADAKILFSLE